MIEKIISGGQTGADLAGLVTGKRFQLATGGWMPKKFKTLDGFKPEMKELYGMQEHWSDSYSARTELNVKDSDGTVRLAGDFKSKGEQCTLRFIKSYKKPYFDIDLTDPPEYQEFIKWIESNNIKVLNVAGNAEQTYLNCFSKSLSYLTNCFLLLGYNMFVSKKQILNSLNLNDNFLIIANEQGIFITK